MCTHEQKECPRCHSVFECKVGNVCQCQCFGFTFTQEEEQLISEKYADCLC
ncbi:MAG TPA: cysteine-rich CWC family protein, partial [Niabella sp.]|nr:cysteine-rich CWC family protein [Niabella sp.]